jgi:tetratricopeptide (TPR) repeat protein
MLTERLNKLMTLHRESPADSFLLFAIAKEYEQMDKKDDALHFYKQLFENDPGYVGLYYHWGKLLEANEAPEQALEIYLRGIDIAMKVKDAHAEKELRGAKYNCEMLM